jgi:hypothetical protein
MGIIQQLITGRAKRLIGLVMVTAIDRHHCGYGLFFPRDSGIPHASDSIPNIKAIWARHQYNKLVL